MTNLRTVVLNPDKTFRVSDGWYVNCGEEFVYSLLLNPIPRNEANLAPSTSYNPAYLLSGSMSVKVVECVLPPSPEDFFAKEEIVHREHVTLSPHGNDLTYYRFFLETDDTISFSSDFTVILDDWAEDSCNSDRYVRVVYASLRKDVPLALDNNNVICISPI